MATAGLPHYTTSGQLVCYFIALSTSWLIYLCRGVSSLDLIKDQSSVATVVHVVSFCGEILTPWTLLFSYYGTDHILFMASLLDMIPYIVWMACFLFKTKHDVEWKWLMFAAIIFGLKAAAFTCLTFGDAIATGVLYVRSCGTCVAAFIPILFLFCWKEWEPSFVHILSLVLRIISSTSDLLFDDHIGDIFLKMGFLKLCRLMTVASAFVNIVTSLVRCYRRQQSQSQNVPPQLPTEGTRVTNPQSLSWYQRLAAAFGF